MKERTLVVGEKMEGGRLVVEALQTERIKYLFSLCGASINPIYDACIDAGIKIIDTRHESAAVYMADVWSRITGKPGVSAVTSGPGHTNSLTGIANAWMANSRVVAISGSYETTHDEMNAMQEMDQTLFTKAITKWSKLITDAATIPRYMAIAFREVMSGIPGPVHLSFAQNALLKKVDISSIEQIDTRRFRTEYLPSGNREVIAKAAEILITAHKPVVIVGSGVLWSKAALSLKAFAETYKVPVFSMCLGRGVLSDDHALSLGYANAQLNGGAKFAFGEADIILFIGQKLNFRVNYGLPPIFNSEAKIIEVDLCAEEIGRNRPIEIGIVGDAGIVLEQLTEAADSTSSMVRDDWLAKIRSYQKDFQKRWNPWLNSSAKPIHPLRLCQEVRKFVDHDTTVVSDGGDILQWARAIIPAYGPARFIDVGPMATIGVGVPFAIAAKLARPKGRVILLSGDGSFGFYIMEFSTAIRHGTPFVAVISNDSAWGMIKNDQLGLYGDRRVIGTELDFIRYDKLVQDLGGFGELVESPEDIAPALQRALASGLPACINVVTQFTQTPITKALVNQRKKYAD